jgi:hypothetical protein
VSQLVLDDLPADVLEQLRDRARVLGVSLTEATTAPLRQAMSLVPVAAVETPTPADGPLIEHQGYLLHTGQLAAGAAWPDTEDLREARVDELVKRSLAGGV